MKVSDKLFLVWLSIFIVGLASYITTKPNLNLMLLGALGVVINVFLDSFFKEK